MLKILVPNRDLRKYIKKICFELGNVLGVKLGVLNDSELIGTMYLSLKPLFAWIIPTPLLYEGCSKSYVNVSIRGKVIDQSVISFRVS